MDKNFQIGIYEKAFPEDLNILDIIELSKTIGFDFFEINIDRTDKRLSRLTDYPLIEKIRSLCYKSDITISSLGLSGLGTYTLGNPDDTNYQKAVSIFKNAVQFSTRLGIRIIQIPAADVPKYDPRNNETKEKFLLTLQEMVSYASQYGVFIGIENMENDFMDTTEKCMEAIRTVNSPYLQLYTDSGNLTNAFKGNLNYIFDDMDQGLGHYYAFHFKEVRENKYGGLFYGDGIVDFENIAKKAYSLGIRRYCMEYWYTGNPSWKEDLIKAKQLCLQWLS